MTPTPTSAPADAIRLFLAEMFQPPAKTAAPAKAPAPKGIPDKAAQGAGIC